jgi:hypothetical protein
MKIFNILKDRGLLSIIVIGCPIQKPHRFTDRNVERQFSGFEWPLTTSYRVSDSVVCFIARTIAKRGGGCQLIQNSADTKSMRSLPSSVDWCPGRKFRPYAPCSQILSIHYRLWKGRTNRL